MKHINQLAIAILASAAGSQAFGACGGVGAATDVTADYLGAGYDAVAAGYTAVCELQGNVPGAGDETASLGAAANETLDSDFLWVLDGKVNFCASAQQSAVEAIVSAETLAADAAYLAPAPVGGGFTLTIEAGATIIGDDRTAAFASNDHAEDYLVINRGCAINASGTALAPITMTSIQELQTPGSGAFGQFGGLYINGQSPNNNLCDAGGDTRAAGEECLSIGEADTGIHGGNDANDNSGTIRYLRMQYAGVSLTNFSDLNGLCLQSVGDGTTVEYVQSIDGGDDGIEIYGGDVDLSHIIVGSNQDDGLDITDGWTGDAQYVLGYNPVGASTNRLFEHNGSNSDLPDITAPFDVLPTFGRISNVTLIDLEPGNNGDSQLSRSRDAANLTYSNMVAYRPTGDGGDCMRADATSTYLSHYCDADTLGSAAPTAYTSTLNGYINGFNEAILAATDASAISADLDPALYAGAFKDCENDWAAGWTFAGSLPAVNQNACVDTVNVPVMGWVGIAAVFAGLTGVASFMRRRVK